MITHFDGGWHRDLVRRGFAYIPPGNYDDSSGWEEHETMFLSDSAVRQLIPLLEDSGAINPRLDERLRAEDLKITHRLLDLLEKLQ